MTSNFSSMHKESVLRLSAITLAYIGAAIFSLAGAYQYQNLGVPSLSISASPSEKALTMDVKRARAVAVPDCSTIVRTHASLFSVYLDAMVLAPSIDAARPSS